MSLRSLPLLPLSLALGVAACGEGSSRGGSATAPASGAPGHSASGQKAPAPPKELDATARIPFEAARAARLALAGVVASRDPAGPAYLAFRRAVARGEPFFRQRGFQAEALLGGGPNDEIGGALGRLDVAMEAKDTKAIELHAGEAGLALQLLEDSFRRAPARAAELPTVVPRAAYWLGAALAGSKPGLSRAPVAAVADAQGSLDAVEEGSRAVGDDPRGGGAEGPRARLAVEIGSLRSALDAAAGTGDIEGRAALVVKTGWLGVAARAALASIGRGWVPYSPRVAARKPGEDEPVSVLTVPAPARASGRDQAETERLAAAGERLFFDRALSAGGARSCASCHVPEKGYADGKAKPTSLLAGSPIERNTPTLLYASLHAAQLWDGRALTSEKQALLVMHSKAEMGGVDAHFPKHGVANEVEAAAALSAFQARSLAPAGSPLDRFARGDEGALSAEERAGFDVLAGKGRCLRCHAPPLFGGSQPTDFATGVFAAIGVPDSPAGRSLDGDRGRAIVTKRALDERAFKTPTLRNVGRTAPYFHNGAFPTLEGVLDFYDKGGGVGLGLDVPNQDPDVRPLRLTASERQAVLRFLSISLSDPPPRG